MAIPSFPFIKRLPVLPPQAGTVVIAAAGRTAGTLETTQVRLHGTAGWAPLGTISGQFPAAPGQRELLAVSVTAGVYDGGGLGAGTGSGGGTVSSGHGGPDFFRHAHRRPVF